MASIHRSLQFDRGDLLIYLFGPEDCFLRRLEQLANVYIVARGSYVSISGSPDDVMCAEATLKKLYARILTAPSSIEFIDLEMTYRQCQKSSSHTTEEEQSAYTLFLNTPQKQQITAQSPKQSYYLRSIFHHDIVFGLGPAGTGKTYLAVACGVALLTQGAVDRLVLCRPAVTAGENLGFLPGDYKEKVDPYLRPLYDALHDLLPESTIQQFFQAGRIEIAPLAYMRGRTLNRSFVILDEAQNTTPLQMKMFLTRLGLFSQMVVTGDLTQVDLPKGITSGLKNLETILSDVPTIRFVHFTSEDVCRHPLVSQILNCYEKYQQ